MFFYDNNIVIWNVINNEGLNVYQKTVWVLPKNYVSQCVAMIS